mgnify:CR=1 FL=1
MIVMNKYDWAFYHFLNISYFTLDTNHYYYIDLDCIMPIQPLKIIHCSGKNEGLNNCDKETTQCARSCRCGYY